ncbi:hypothetical protein AX16_004348 [Volvariella volvacea WC 439]|nr:hypothetical protein AX16_004348 [Volvariella volvacea WC 439]
MDLFSPERTTGHPQYRLRPDGEVVAQDDEITAHPLATNNIQKRNYEEPQEGRPSSIPQSPTVSDAQATIPVVERKDMASKPMLNTPPAGRQRTLIEREKQYDLNSLLEVLRSGGNKVRELERELCNAQALHAKSTKEISVLKQYNNQLGTVIMNKENTLRGLNAELRSTREAHWQAVEELQQADGLHGQLAAVCGKLRSKTELLDQRTNELKTVEAYLSRNSMHSDTDLKEMVERLNQEISQTCSTIVDCLDFSSSIRQVAPDIEREQLFSCFEDSLPRAFLDRVTYQSSGPSDETDATWITIALQAIMAKHVSIYAQSWCPLNKDRADFLKEIYQGLILSDPFTAPRWRVMTRSQIRQKYTNDQEIKDCQLGLWRKVTTMLILCGWTGDYMESMQSLDAIKHGILVIATKTLQLNQALLEGTLGSDVELVELMAGDTFDGIYADDGLSKRADGSSECQLTTNKVLCTTDLGLKITLLGHSPKVVLKAKVILEEALNEYRVPV